MRQKNLGLDLQLKNEAGDGERERELINFAIPDEIDGLEEDRCGILGAGSGLEQAH